MQTARGSSELHEAYSIGNYGLGFKWADGHDEGIYSWRYLRAFCPCVACRARLLATADERAE